MRCEHVPAATPSNRLVFTAPVSEIQLPEIDEVPSQPDTLGDLPLIVLTASEHPAPVKDFTPAGQKKYFDFWWEGHNRVAALSSEGKNILAAPSGHFIQREHPLVVVQYVDQVVEAVRHGKDQNQHPR